MFTLDVSVGAVLHHEGELLLIPRGEADQAVYEIISGDFVMGLTLPAMIEHALGTKLDLAAAATKLLYIVERFYTKGNTDVHDITHYYFCEPTLTNAGTRIKCLAEDGKIALVKPADLGEGALAPACLREILVADAGEEFNVSPKLIVDNALGEKCGAVSGVFRA